MTTLTPSRPHLCLTTWLLGAALLAGASATQAQIKRWVDERGVVHYSDQTPAKGETRGPVKTIDTPPPPTALEQVRAEWTESAPPTPRPGTTPSKRRVI